MTTFFKRIELNFWNVMIYTLSNSKTVRNLIRDSYRLLKNKAALTTAALVIGLSSIAGIFAGFSLFVLTVALR